MRRIGIAIALLLVLSAAAAARGEIFQKGSLRVTFDTRLLPRALPRERLAPVTVKLDGAVSTVDSTRPPQLRELSLAFNRAGRITVEGLPRCTAAELQQTSSEAALAACRSALVGHGRFGAAVDFPDAPQIPAQGRVLVFNSRIKGRPAMLLHLYGSSPVRAAFVLPFLIDRSRSGELGTLFSTRIPQLASDLGYVTDIELSIGRTYRYRGERRSFISASCAAPAGFPSAVFELAKATFVFAGGQRLSGRILRDCKVR
jgi:hypothetical protein